MFDIEQLIKKALAPKVTPPLHGRIPDPEGPVYGQSRINIDDPSAPPVAPPLNAVTTQPPVTTTGNTALPGLAEQVAAKQGEYNAALATPAKHQNPWMQAAFLTLQGIQRIADPKNPANAQPIEWLGNAKKADKVGRLQGELAPLLQQRDIEQKHRAGNIAIDDKLEDNSRMRDDLDRKREADKTRSAYWNRKADQGDLKLAGDDELRTLRDKWAVSKDATDKRRLDLVEEEMKNRTARNAANIGSREKIAGMQQQGRDADRSARMQTVQAALQAKIQKEAADGVLDKAKYSRMLAEDLSAGKIDEQMYNALLGFLK